VSKELSASANSLSESRECVIEVYFDNQWLIIIEYFFHQILLQLQSFQKHSTKMPETNLGCTSLDYLRWLDADHMHLRKRDWRHRHPKKLDCLKWGNFEQCRGLCMLWQNIYFIFMITTKVWVMISQQINSGKNWNKNVTTNSYGKEWANYFWKLFIC
jgi:hypothetical protein